MRFLPLLTFVFINLIAVQFASAETILLKDGRTIDAKIVSFSDEGIKIQDVDLIKIIPNADVAKINGRSFTADLTVIGMDPTAVTQESKQRKPQDILKDVQKKISSLNTVSLSAITEKITNKSSRTQKRPDWFWPTAISVMVLAYLLFCLPYCMMAEKTDLGTGWQILMVIPVLQLIAWVRLGDKPLWWTLLLFIPLVNVIVLVILFCGMSKRCGKEPLLGLLMLVPVINLFFPWYLALNAQQTTKITKSPATGAVGTASAPKRYSITPFENESQKS